MERDRYAGYKETIEEIEKTSGLKEGAHIRYIGITDDQLKFLNYMRSDDPRNILDVDTVYEIECMAVSREYSIVYLVGVRGKFSPLFFEVIDKNEKKKELKEGGFVNFVGGNCYIHNIEAAKVLDSLDYVSTYEVECIKLDPYRFGYTMVKLVGFEVWLDRAAFEKVK